jgi:hypothetical protein
MELTSWRDTATREAIVEFAESAAQDVPPEERVAVFDNDGTLWCEKPMPIELGIASGVDRDFMRTVSHELYGIPPERVIGSSNALRYEDDEHGGSVVYLAEPDVFDDGPVKPVRIWSRVGRRPILAGGNSNGDVPMLRYAGGPSRPALRLLVLHDDAEREFDYVAGAERSLEAAKLQGWTVVSVKDDWATVFADSA